MSDLDKKLKSIIVQVDPKKPVAVFIDKNALDRGDIEYLSEEATGWPKDSVFVLIDGDPEKLVKVSPLMTGQEWYDRFARESEAVNYYGKVGESAYIRPSDVLKAAKKASGIQ